MQPFGQQSIFNQNSPELTKLNRGKVTNCSEIRRVTSSVFVHPLFAFCRHSPQLILRLHYVFHRGHEPWENFAERSPIISELIDSINTSVCRSRSCTVKRTPSAAQFESAAARFF